MADDNKTTNATSTAKPAAAEPTKAATPAEAKPAAKAPAKPRTVKAPTIRRPAVRRTAVKAAAPAAAAKETSLKEVSLDDPSLYINRDISWIEFDRKVLETAMDPEIPLLNRVLFLSIFYNNLDEFFMVRVMNVQRQARSGAEPTGPDKMPPARQLSEIRRKVTEILEEAENLWIDTLKPELENKGIRFSKYSALNAAQKKEMNRYFDEDIFPVLTPQAVDKGRPFPMISNTSLNFVMELEAIESGISVKNRFARLKCPNNVPRFLFVSNKDNTVTPDLSYATTEGVIVLTEDLIGNRLNTLFPGYKVKSQGLFRITRNTDGEIEEDEADDLLSAVRDYVEQRRFGSIVRVEIEKGMPQRLQDFLYEHLDLHPNQFYRCRVPLAFSEFGRMMKIDRSSLKYPSDHPKTPKAFEQGRNCFDEIRKRDILVYHPYDSFNCVLEFLKQAALDPNVVAIKQTLYRCGNNSPIVQSLIEARRRGKQVTAVVELKARFDEERNITWAEELEKAGVNVVYGIVGMKIHAKLCLVVRREEQGVVRYAHVGTGNYNASTAKIYTDMGIFTANQDVCQDITDLFNVMTGYAVRKEYRSLLVSPVSMRHGLISHIQKEVELHKKQGGGEIILKCNQLVDKKIIKELYRASMAGVRVRLIIRGICCLRPGVPGISDNITVTSIVGRFLEHARVYWFRNGGDGIMYIGSADIMPRNLDRRIEVLIPVSNGEIRRHIREYVLDRQLRDNMQSWHMCPDGTYKRVHLKDGEEPVNAQEMLLDDEPFIPAPER